MNSLPSVIAQSQNQHSGEVIVQVIVKQGSDGRTIATVLGFPEVSVEASDRVTALAQLQTHLEAYLAGTEILSLPVKLPQFQQKNPWLEMAGIFKDDPQFDQMLEAIASYRRELDVELETDSPKLDAQAEAE